MEELLKKGADVHTGIAVDIILTPLYPALLKGFLDAAKALLKYDAYNAETINDVLILLNEPPFNQEPGNDEKVKGIKALIKEFDPSQQLITAQQTLVPHNAIIP